MLAHIPCSLKPLSYVFRQISGTCLHSSQALVHLIPIYCFESCLRTVSFRVAAQECCLLPRNSCGLRTGKTWPAGQSFAREHERASRTQNTQKRGLLKPRFVLFGFCCTTCFAPLKYRFGFTVLQRSLLRSSGRSALQ
jgi:hypothetical protein